MITAVLWLLEFSFGCVLVGFNSCNFHSKTMNQFHQRLAVNKIVLTFIAIAIIFHSKNVSECRQIVWTPKTNIGDAENWVDNAIPCSSDIVEFPEQTNELNIFTSLSAKEIILPKSGGFVLDRKATIKFSENDSNCRPNRTRIFKRIIGARWLDARNWNVSEADSESPVNKATPHEERLPCDNDEIIFPINNSYVVDLQSVPTLSFKSAMIDGRVVAVNRFSEFLMDAYGQSMFKNSLDTEFAETSSCNDDSKCVCHQKSATLREQLCQNEQPNCEPKQNLPCVKPFRPIGHCCDECGAMFQMKIDELQSFNLKSFKSATIQGKFHTCLCQISDLNFISDSSQTNSSNKWRRSQ